MNKTAILQQVQKNKAILISFVIFIVAFILFNHPSREKPVAKERIFADTLIPKGHVLVPIELANIESISALIDQYGVVDLYAGSPNSQGSRRIVSRVKILRAPLNPNQYAVLVPDHLSNSIMQVVGPFWAVVQNRQTTSEQNPQQKSRSIAIEYYKGG